MQKAYRHLQHLTMLPAPIACRHTGSGLFHSPPGVLFTFPSRYCFTIGHLSCLALDHGRPEFNRNFTCSGILRYFAHTGYAPSHTGLSPSTVGFPNTVQLTYSFCNCPEHLQTFPARTYYTDVRNACRLTRTRFRLIPFRSPLLRESLRFLLYPATEMFHFAGFAPAYAGLRPTPERLPHSDIFGSRAACASPKLFAAYRVLRR